MTRMDDPGLVAREYSTAERLERRQVDATGWIRGDEAWEEALAAVAAARPYIVLDAGCGNGRFARAIAAPNVVGIDSSAAMVEQAIGRGVDAREADIQDLPFRDDEFDVVVSNWTLYHLPDLERGLAELARVTRRGGRFVGIYNRERHMEELWSAVRPEFGRGDELEGPLGRHFARVEWRDTESYSLWESREALQEYLDAFAELAGPLEAPAEPYPFRATRRNRVYVAEKE
jgi:ubiquinone/menaquinone biosynthesis C-methylase UbiE